MAEPQPEPYRRIMEMAREQGVEAISDIDALVAEDMTDAEAEAFLSALRSERDATDLYLETLRERERLAKRLAQAEALMQNRVALVAGCQCDYCKQVRAFLSGDETGIAGASKSGSAIAEPEATAPARSVGGENTR